MKVAVLQSNYLPWRGYFDIVNKVDAFIFYDDVQYTKNDWRNRNVVKGPNGPFWLTIPIHKDSVKLNINQVKITNPNWQKKHLQSIRACYANAPFYPDYINFFEKVYTQKEWSNLSKLNQYLIKEICVLLGIKTKFLDSSDFHLAGNKTDRLISLLKQVNATHYLSGPAAKDYIEAEKFESAGISLEYQDYNYLTYRQQWGSFISNVSIIDLLFNLGPNAINYIQNKNENSI